MLPYFQHFDQYILILVTIYYVFNTRFCKSCAVKEEYTSAQPVNRIDSICQEYVEDVAKKKNPTRTLDNLLHEMGLIQTNESMIFGISMEARFIYEEVYDEPYSFRLLVEPALPTSENCLTAYVDGTGFMNRNPNSNFTKEELKYWEIGKKYEQMYIEAVVYLWSEYKCDKSSNKEFVSSH